MAIYSLQKLFDHISFITVSKSCDEERKNKSKASSSSSNKYIIIGSLNIQGGFVTKTKLNDFHRLLNSCHIFGVQETWLENQESFKVSDFEHFRSERAKGKKARRNSGGVLLFYKKSIAEGVEKQTSANKHFIWVKLKSNFFKLDKDIFLCCAYIPSTNSKYFNDSEDKVSDLLKQDIENYSNLGNIIVFGDLNCRLGEKPEELSFIDSDCEDQDYLNTIEIPIESHRTKNLTPQEICF